MWGKRSPKALIEKKKRDENPKMKYRIKISTNPRLWKKEAGTTAKPSPSFHGGYRSS
jgi:hypothetical protein